MNPYLRTSQVWLAAIVALTLGCKSPASRSSVKDTPDGATSNATDPTSVALGQLPCVQQVSAGLPPTVAPADLGTGTANNASGGYSLILTPVDGSGNPTTSLADCLSKIASALPNQLKLVGAAYLGDTTGSFAMYMAPTSLNRTTVTNTAFAAVLATLKQQLSPRASAATSGVLMPMSPTLNSASLDDGQVACAAGVTVTAPPTLAPASLGAMPSSSYEIDVSTTNQNARACLTQILRVCANLPHLLDSSGNSLPPLKVVNAVPSSTTAFFLLTPDVAPSTGSPTNNGAQTITATLPLSALFCPGSCPGVNFQSGGQSIWATGAVLSAPLTPGQTYQLTGSWVAFDASSHVDTMAPPGNQVFQVTSVVP